MAMVHIEEIEQLVDVFAANLRLSMKHIKQLEKELSKLIIEEKEDTTKGIDYSTFVKYCCKK